ncbi:MAG: type II toxin-antitoxin system RelE/ParE family toxin [candidate division WOR-3 bacterium]|nr:type II toxin-antitoxin system RelE/ParE family toxin [candidate division WOR-3 bacterium]
MDVLFADRILQKLETGGDAAARWSPGIVRAFRKTVHVVRQAVDERDLRNLRSLHFEKLKGKRSHQCSMRLNDQYRLIVELNREGARKQVTVIGIEDYH